MNVTRSALSLNVPDPQQSAQFVEQHFGFQQEMAFESMVSLQRPDVPFNLIYLQTGLSTFKPTSHAGSAREGLLVVFVVDNIDQEYQRLQQEGAPIVTPIETESWGERYFQTCDPNGILYQLVQWMEDPIQEVHP
ncbi:VOC family protein [Deinococcus misasensis]|uniref:VOC family protein n=1 Tax=Deinococcus misasensis TaxID=392413 RepID=UPI0005506F74|nr:VOC family protein [Deinococcus misasensis]